MGARTQGSQPSLPLRRWGRLVAPALLVSAALLLVVDHWEHFDGGDFALLVLILGAAVMQILTPAQSGRTEAGGEHGRSASAPRNSGDRNHDTCS